MFSATPFFFLVKAEISTLSWSLQGKKPQVLQGENDKIKSGLGASAAEHSR